MAKKVRFKKTVKFNTKRYAFYYKHHYIKVILDKVSIFRIIHKLHGRFWGVAAAVGLSVGIVVCFLIRPDMFKVSTAISDFSMDIRTAPYFTVSILFAAYGLYRWRDYLKRTLKRTRPISGLIALTILGLCVVALMPNGWHPWPGRLHLIAMALLGASAAATVVFDILLSKIPRGHNANSLRFIKMVSFLLIVVGGWLTLGSSNWLRWFSISLPAELMLLSGYFIWVILKTYQGEAPRSSLSRLLKKVILVD